MAQVIKSAGFGSASGSAEKTPPASAREGAARAFHGDSASRQQSAVPPDDPRLEMLRHDLVWLVRVQRELANAARVLEDVERHIEVESAGGRSSALAAYMELACPSYRDPFCGVSALELLTELGSIILRHAEELPDGLAAREGA